MESTDVLQRIIRLHWFVVALFALLGLAVGGAVARRGATSYSSSARVALGTTTPQTQDEATAVGSVARAIVTSPTRVRDAIGLARVQRDPVDVADHHVSVQSLGLSNVVELTLSDRDPKVARSLTNALAAELERTWLGIGHGQSPQVVADLNARLDALNQKIGDLDAQINTTVAPANGSDPVRTLLARREDLARQAVALETERDRLVSQDAADVRAEIIDRASTPTGPDRTGQAQALVLGGIAGLVAGLGLAALLEALAPSLLGARRIAAAAGTIVLGRVRMLPAVDGESREDLDEIATRVGLAARSAGVETVELVGAPPVNLAPLAHAAQVILANPSNHATANAPRANGNGKGTGRALPLVIREFEVGASRGRGALVLVTPNHLKVRALGEVLDLPALTGCPFLGVVTYERAAVAPNRPARPAAGAPTAPETVDPAVEPELDRDLTFVRGEGSS